MAKDKEPIADADQETFDDSTSTGDNDTVADTAEEPKVEDAKPDHAHHGGRIKRLARRYWRKKKLTIPLTLLVALAVVLAVPFTRYKTLALFVKEQFSVTVVDAQTGNPVSGANVSLAGRTAQTDAEGSAILQDVPVGDAELAITKSYYEDYSASVLVSLSDSQNNTEAHMAATGRQVPVSVTNRITGKPLAGVTLSVLETTAKTDDKGVATIVLPPDEPTQKITLKLDGYNDTNAEIQVTTQETDKNKFKLTPAGRVFFLSKRSGNIDVVSTNLDGTDRKTVLKGTGKEDDGSTVMLASRDWKYLALKSRREGTKAKLYLIETDSGKLTVMDEGDAEFATIGWHDHDFVYTVSRERNIWQPKRLALKSYNADNKSITVMHENEAHGGEFGYVSQNLGGFYIVNDGLVYTTGWDYTDQSRLDGRKSSIIKATIGSTDKMELRSFSAKTVNYIYAKSYAHDEIYYAVWSSGEYIFYEYEDGVVKTAEADQNSFFVKQYPTYLLSPSGNAVFWAEQRDGKNTLLIGDSNGENEKSIASLSEQTPYGWFTDEYLLVSKDGSELYIMSREKDSTPLKISDYHKPQYNSRGYGYGYGGF